MKKKEYDKGLNDGIFNIRISEDLKRTRVFLKKKKRTCVFVLFWYVISTLPSHTLFVILKKKKKMTIRLFFRISG